MVSLNKIGTRVLEHEPKARVAFFLGHPVGTVCSYVPMCNHVQYRYVHKVRMLF